MVLHRAVELARLTGSWLLRRYSPKRNRGILPGEAEISGSLPRLAQLRKLLCDVETSVRRSSNPDSDVSVVPV